MFIMAESHEVDLTALMMSPRRSYFASLSRSSSTKRRSFWSCRIPQPSSSICDASRRQSWIQGKVTVFSRVQFYMRIVYLVIVMSNNKHLHLDPPFPGSWCTSRLWTWIPSPWGKSRTAGPSTWRKSVWSWPSWRPSDRPSSGRERRVRTDAPSSAMMRKITDLEAHQISRHEDKEVFSTEQRRVAVKTSEFPVRLDLVSASKPEQLTF